jgi:hypothetical protein
MMVEAESAVQCACCTRCCVGYQCCTKHATHAVLSTMLCSAMHAAVHATHALLYAQCCAPLTDEPVFDCRSDPARSTRLSLPALMCWAPSLPSSLHSTVTMKMACDRELCTFMFVALRNTRQGWLELSNDVGRRAGGGQFRGLG